MKKYFINCGTDHYKKIKENWEFNAGTSENVNDKYIKIYENYDEAIEVYNSIIIEKDVQKWDMYAEYKELYEIDESIECINDIDFDKATLLKDEYSYIH